MGNVLATSKPITSAANQFLGANPETSPSSDQDGNKNTSEPLENPGTMEELHKKCKGAYFHSSERHSWKNYPRNSTTKITSKNSVCVCFGYVTILKTVWCFYYQYRVCTHTHNNVNFKSHTCFSMSFLFFIDRRDASKF